MSSLSAAALTRFINSGVVNSVFAALLALRVERRLEEGHGRDARNFDRILEGEEEAFRGPRVGLEFENILAVEQHFAGVDLIILLPAIT